MNKHIIVAAKLMRVDRPIGFFLLVWPCLWTLWVLNNGKPDLTLVIWILIGAILARSSGCIINDICDYQIDAKVARTQYRPLALGLWSRTKAWGLFTILLILMALLAIHLQVIYSGLIAVVLMCLYPLFKRFFFAPQIWLGLNWGWSVFVVWDACKLNFTHQLFWLFAMAFFWTMAFDTFYAITDRAFDKKLNINSFAIWLGRHDILGISICYALMLLSWLKLISTFNSWGYLLVASVPICGFIAAILYYCRNREPAKCFRAFLANNLLGAYIWLLLVLFFWQHSI